MDSDNQHRRYRFIQASDTTEFGELIAGWLELAEGIAPRTPKAILEGNYLAYLPDNTRFKEVSYKTEHVAVDSALTQWSCIANRSVARVEGSQLSLSDGRQFPLDQVRFERLQ